MHLADPEQLEQVGLTLYERKALMALMLCGVADAATLCREGGVPTSKIYLAMEKLAGLGLVQVQPTRPKMFAALPSEGVALAQRCSARTQPDLTCHFVRIHGKAERRECRLTQDRSVFSILRSIEFRFGGVWTEEPPTGEKHAAHQISPSQGD